MHKAGCTVDFNVECKNPVDVTVDVTVDVKKNVGIQTVDVKFE